MLDGYGASLLEGAMLTLGVALGALVIAAALGIAGAMARLSRHRVLRGAAQVYTTVVRGVPDLVMMFLVYFGGQLLVNRLAERFQWGDVTIDPFVAGTLTIGFIFGAYMTEIFRGAFLAVPAGQREAALAYGMTPAAGAAPHRRAADAAPRAGAFVQHVAGDGQEHGASSA